MKIDRATLDAAVGEGIVDAQQAHALWRFLEARGADTPSFRMTHILYYLGGMLAIGAMSLFMTLGFGIFGGWGITGLALAYAALAVYLTNKLLERPGLRVPAGVSAAFAVVLVPLAVYGVQLALGQWDGTRPYRDYHVIIDGRWLVMELATLLVGWLALRRWGLPFLMMPIAVTLWYMTMDLAPALFRAEDLDWTLRKQVSMLFGFAMLVLAVRVDLRSRDGRDFGFWLHLFGVLAFWGGLSAMKSSSEIGRFVYFLINLAMIASAAALSRRVYAVFGGLGVAIYVGHLAYSVFKSSVLFPFALTAIGFGVVWLGIVWQRHEKAIGERLLAWLPVGVREAVAARRQRA